VIRTGLHGKATKLTRWALASSAGGVIFALPLTALLLSSCCAVVSWRSMAIHLRNNDISDAFHLFPPVLHVFGAVFAVTAASASGGGDALRARAAAARLASISCIMSCAAMAATLVTS